MPSEPPGPSSAGLPRASEPGAPSGRKSRDTWFGETAPSRRFLSRWGFTIFVLIVVFLGRAVLLPFVFAGLIAYILAPVILWMSQRKNGTLRMPRGLAIIICYIIFLAAVTGFMFLLVPRLSGDIARLGKEAPGLYKRIDREWTPSIARWLERRFPSLAPVKVVPEEQQPLVSDVPVPPGTAFTVTPLPDGRLALQLTPNGVDLKPTPDGGFHLQALEAPPEPVTLDDKLRTYIKRSIVGLQSKLDDVDRVFQGFVTGFIKGIFGFFFTLMIGAFLLIDLD